jgi:putative membrane protein
VPAIVGKADVYAEIPWIAFAAGVSFGALAVVVSDYLRPVWVTASTAALHAVVMLAAGAVGALLAVVSAPLARLLLRGHRAEIEVRQYAESLFLRRGLSVTRQRTGVLLLVSLFERRIEIVADSGFAGRMSDGDWRGVIARMTPHLRDRRPFEALRDALAAIEELLAAKGFRGEAGAPNELPDAAVEERGQ